MRPDAYYYAEPADHWHTVVLETDSTCTTLSEDEACHLIARLERAVEMLQEANGD